MVRLHLPIARALALPAAILAFGCSDVPTVPSETSDYDRGKLNVGRPLDPPDPPDDPPKPETQTFIVALLDDQDPVAVAEEHGIDTEFVYTHVMKGFAASISEAARAGLLQDARVRRVVADATVQHQAVFAGGSQPGAPWGLDRIDQRETQLDGLYSFQATGAGVTAYIMDTGIRYDHLDFGGRARLGYDIYGEDGSDCYGHGTHVAGTVGGATYGVAKDVELVSVRVLDCNGFGGVGGVLSGLDWIAANHTRPAVVNLSLLTGGLDMVDDAAQRLIDAGVTVVVAAGNYAKDACDYSPGRVKDAITVGATRSDDFRASFSNTGRCIDLFAPGENITSTYSLTPDATRSMSGTSMSAPHATGVAALYLESSPLASPGEVAAALVAQATQRAVHDAQSRNDHLLFTDGGSPGGDPVNAPPQADFSFSCSDLSCSFTDQSHDNDGTVTAWSWDFGTGDSSTESNPTYAFTAQGTYPVTLSVTDDDGAVGTATRDVSVGTAPPDNQAPSAQFSFACQQLECQFTDESTDPDGTVSAWIWSFGPGAASQDPSPAHVFPSSGTYTVSLTVVDDGGAEATSNRLVIVYLEDARIELEGASYREKGRHFVELRWTGAEGSAVVIFRDDEPLDPVANTGLHLDEPGGRGKNKSYRYRVCEADTGVCSPEIVVEF